MHTLARSLWWLLALAGCTCATSGSLSAESSGGEPTTPPSNESDQAEHVSYEVHEWGLVRGTGDDRAVLSGPHASPRVMPLAKPVLYFHRRGEGALVVDVEARIASGRIVEHWPSTTAEPTARVAWHGVTIQAGSCSGSRYPSASEEPCAGLVDGCEASTLAGVEAPDADCLFWPPPPADDGPTQAWNHLFYRGEIEGTPRLPLRLEPLADGSIRAISESTAPIPGRLVRVRRAGGTPGLHDAVAIVAPPGPGRDVVIGEPSAPSSDGAAALAASLREAGLTESEIAAFRRSWDAAIFGSQATASTGTVVTATPLVPAPARASTSIVYVLPRADADALATLSFTPPPAAVRRAIVVWLEE